MFSITGYFFFGSKFDGLTMTPQMSVLPSRALATNTSGALKPAASSAEMSGFSSVLRSDRSLVRRSSDTFGRSTRE